MPYDLAKLVTLIVRVPVGLGVYRFDRLDDVPLARAVERVMRAPPADADPRYTLIRYDGHALRRDEIERLHEQIEAACP